MRTNRVPEITGRPLRAPSPPRPASRLGGADRATLDQAVDLVRQAVRQDGAQDHRPLSRTVSGLTILIPGWHRREAPLRYGRRPERRP